MKNTRPLLYPVLIMMALGCKKDDTRKAHDYIFLERFCAIVTVGGVVGIAEKCFETGEAVSGLKNGDHITIRIAGPSPLNEGPPSSASFQEFLDVPSSYLQLVNR